MKYIIKHTFETSPEQFWGRVFFDSDYNRELYCNHLDADYEELEIVRKQDGSVRRSIRVQPRMALPAILKRFFGNKVAYTETGEYDAASGHFVATVQPTVAADKLVTRLDVWTEQRSERRLERFIEVENHVHILGVGGMIESTLAKQTREANEVIAAFTAEWIARTLA